jgi:microcystin degradation protein MlrC
VLISFEGRQVTVVAGPRAARLIAALRQAGDDPAAVQLLLAKATRHFKHGTERQGR